MSRQRRTNLTFLGTRGEIDVRSRRHRRHSSLLVEHRAARIMIDCGADWLGRVKRVAPTAILLTHAHADHAAGLAAGAPCPVYATRETWDLIGRYPIRYRRKILAGKPIVVDGLRIKAFPVKHSIRAPAVGFRISVRGKGLIYLPDVAEIPNASTIIRNIDLYIGDGATMSRAMVRRKQGVLIGHAAIANQLRWCKQAGIRRAIFTHCGSPIVRGDTRALSARLSQLGRRHGVEARFAYDGDRLLFCS
jgi:phosphoribosyl 1,2-cyclic phosphodiesterase